MDLYIVYFGNNSEDSRIIGEIIEYVVSLVEKKYGLAVFYQSLIDEDSEYPYVLINDYDPIHFDRIPDIDTLLNMMLMASQTSLLGEGFVSGKNNGAHLDLHNL